MCLTILKNIIYLFSLIETVCLFYISINKLLNIFTNTFTYMCFCVYAFLHIICINPTVNLNYKSSPLNHEHVITLITVTSLCGTTLPRTN